MTRKSKKLEEIVNLTELEEIVENIETLELDAIFVQKINENTMMIVDERISGHVPYNVENIILLIIFAAITRCNTFTEIHIFGCPTSNG